MDLGCQDSGSVGFREPIRLWEVAEEGHTVQVRSMGVVQGELQVTMRIEYNSGGGGGGGRTSFGGNGGSGYAVVFWSE